MAMNMKKDNQNNSAPGTRDLDWILKRALPEPIRDPQFHVSRGVRISGDVQASANGRVDGTVEGAVSVGERTLTVGKDGLVVGDVRAASVLVKGKLVGDVIATTAVEIAPGGSVEGDVVAPRFTLGLGARFRGKVNRRQFVRRPRTASRPVAWNWAMVAAAAPAID